MCPKGAWGGDAEKDLRHRRIGHAFTGKVPTCTGARPPFQEGRRSLTEWEGGELLRCYGFQTLPSFIAKSRQEAVEYAQSLTFPVVLKIVSPQILHKSDAQGVKINLGSPEEVAAAYDEILANAKAYNPEAEIVGVLVQKMAPRGEEVILGMTRYPVFGPLLMFGLGGIFVEIFKDVVSAWPHRPK